MQPQPVKRFFHKGENWEDAAEEENKQIEL
jgi:hypothetical protein